jgi:cell division septum initiation protein DivIVA
MSNLSEIVDSLENKIKQLLQQHESLNKSYSDLQQELTIEKNGHSKTRESLLKCKDESENLRVVNAMLGSDQFKRETKLKINTLIREIDVCISQLNN